MSKVRTEIEVNTIFPLIDIICVIKMYTKQANNDDILVKSLSFDLNKKDAMKLRDKLNEELVKLSYREIQLESDFKKYE